MSLTLKEISKGLEFCSRRLGGSIVGNFLDHWMHYLRVELLPDNRFDQEVYEVVLQSHELFIQQVSDGNGNYTGCFDLFGSIFEEFGGKKEKQYMGQFFTPECLSELMSKMIYNDNKQSNNKVKTINDPASGSGRGLIGFHEEFLLENRSLRYPSTGVFYYANDIDVRCTKMSFINMFLHGMNGEATNADALNMEYRFGYSLEHVPIALWVEKNYADLSNAEMQDIFNYHFYKDTWMSNLDQTLVISNSMDNHFHLVKRISQQEGHLGSLEPEQPQEEKPKSQLSLF